MKNTNNMKRRYKQYERIRNLREDKDLRQRELAALLNCHQRTYSNYECGDLDIPTEYLIEISRFYETSVDYLLGLTDVKKPYPKSKEKNI